MATDNKRIAKNALFLYVRMFLSLGISLLTAGVTLRVLGEVDYGLYAVLGGIVAMFGFLNGSLAGAASRNITFAIGQGDRETTNKVFNASLVVFCCLGLLIVLLCETVGLWLFYKKMVIPAERLDIAFWVLQFSIVGVPLSLSQIPYNAVLIAHENMKVYAYTSIVDQVARLAIIYFLLVSPFDKLLTLSSLHFSLGIVMLVFYRIYCIKKYSETKIRMCQDGRMYKNVLQFAGSDLIGNLSCMAQGQGFNLLLNTFFGPAVNAARGIAYGLQGMTTQFSSNFMTAVVPQIIKSYAQGDYDGMWQLVRRSSCFSYYLVWMLALPAWLEGDYVLTLWLGKYPDHTLSFFHLIVIACLIETLRRPLIKVMHATGKIFLGNITVGTVLCLSFPVAYVLLRMGYSPESVFGCTIVSMVIGGMMEWFVLNHYLKYDVAKYVIAVYGRCAIVTVVSLAVPVLICPRMMEASFLRMILTGLITTVSVGFSALYLGMSRSDRQKLLALASSKLGQIRRKAFR